MSGGAKLMDDQRAAHYWDPERLVGVAYQQHIANLSSPAWDVWMLYEPGVLWEGEAPPQPTWWEHQLSRLEGHDDRWLAPDRFARKALEMSVAAD